MLRLQTCGCSDLLSAMCALRVSCVYDNEVTPSRLHLAGTPCTDYSPRGDMLRSDGKTFLSFLCWCGMRCRLQEPTTVQENVEGFDTAELHRTVGHLFHIDVSVMTPTSYGFPVSRPRKWTILRHRYKTKSWSGPWNMFTKMFQTDLWLGMYTDEMAEKIPAWDIFFNGNEKAMYDELVWACGRPDSRLKQTGCPFKSLEEFCDANANKPEAVKDAFYNALTTAEADFLTEYKAQKPQQAYSLNQNPAVSFTSSHQSNLHAIIKNAGIIWHHGLIWNQCFGCDVRE